MLLLLKNHGKSSCRISQQVWENDVYTTTAAEDEQNSVVVRFDHGRMVRSESFCGAQLDHGKPLSAARCSS